MQAAQREYFLSLNSIKAHVMDTASEPTMVHRFYYAKAPVSSCWNMKPASSPAVNTTSFAVS